MDMDLDIYDTFAFKKCKEKRGEERRKKEMGKK